MLRDGIGEKLEEIKSQESEWESEDELVLG